MKMAYPPPGRDSITGPRAAGINRRSIMIEKRAHTAREGRHEKRRSEWKVKRKQQQPLSDENQIEMI